MLLAIDAGNTNVVFALLEGRAVRGRWRIATDPRRTGDEYAVWLMQLLAIRGVKAEEVDQIIISTVVPRALHNLEILARHYFNLEPLLAGVGKADYGIDIDVDEPRSLGADRAVNAIAAHDKHPGDLIVVDFGTATTFDVIDFNGAYKGGIIAPGINLSMQALHEAAAKLPRIAIQRPAGNKIVGTDTVSAMQSGVFWGYISLIEGLVSRIKAERGEPMTVIATGGVASLFEGATDSIDHFDSDLTIRGLLEIYRRNTISET